MRKCSRYQARYEMQHVASYNLDVPGGLVKRRKTRGSTRRVTKKNCSLSKCGEHASLFRAGKAIHLFLVQESVQRC